MVSLALACLLGAAGASAAVVSPSGRCCGEAGLPECVCPPLEGIPQDQRVERVIPFPTELGGRPYELRFRMAHAVTHDGSIEQDTFGCSRYARTYSSSERLEVVNGAGAVEYDVDLHAGGVNAVLVLEGAQDRALLLVEATGGSDYYAEFKLRLLANRGHGLVEVGPPVALRGMVAGLSYGGQDRRPSNVRLGAGDTLEVVMQTLFDATCPFPVDWGRGIQVPSQLECTFPSGGIRGTRSPDEASAGEDEDARSEMVVFDDPRADAPSTPIELAPGVPVTGSRLRAGVRVGENGVFALDDDDLWLEVEIEGRRGWLHRPVDFGVLGMIEDRC